MKADTTIAVLKTTAMNTPRNDIVSTPVHGVGDRRSPIAPGLGRS
jgi:hypothetical protein